MLLLRSQSRDSALQQEKQLRWEAHAPQLESSSCSLQLEKGHLQQRRPSTANIYIYTYIFLGISILKCAVDIISNHEGLDAFLLGRTRQECHFSPILSHVKLVILDNTIKQEKDSYICYEE